MNIKLAKTISLAQTNTFTQLKASGKFAIKNGFTLAEVLITLTIIGIVAAMTIPTLLSNYQNQTYVTGLKKGYSILSQAAIMAPLQTGCDFETNTGEGCSMYRGNDLDGNYTLFLLSKVLKTVKYDTAEEIYNGSLNFDDFSNTHLIKSGHAILLSDGMIIEDCSNGFCLDVNGGKGPNKLGRDIFTFGINSPTTNNYNDSVAIGMVFPYGGKTDDEYFNHEGTWQQTGECTTENASNKNFTSQEKAKHYCTARVLEEGAMNY